MNWKLLVTAVLLIGASAFTLAAQPGAAPAVAGGGEPDFKGKVLVISIDETGGTIQNARVQRLAGRAFLVGESIKRTDDDPHPEETMWFPVDKITLFRVFKNIEDARKVFDQADPLGRHAAK